MCRNTTGLGIYDTDLNAIKNQSEYIGKSTNNEAEYRALIAALDGGGY